MAWITYAFYWTGMNNLKNRYTTYMQTKEQALEFLNLVKGLKDNGHKMQEISNVLGMHPPVLSSLYKTVLPAIIQPSTESISEDKVTDKAFGLVNNISKDKTLRNLATYVSTLKSISEEKNNSQNLQFYDPYKKVVANSYSFMCSNLLGLYDCFTHSSNSNTIKHEPLLISDKSIRKYVEVNKGNKFSQFPMEGFMFLCGSHMITIHLFDSKDDIQEAGMLQLIQPFMKDFKLLRGIYLSLGFSRAPIARRVVLSKVSAQCSREEFNEIPTKYYQKDDCPSDICKEIIDYISDQNDIIECFSLPHPAFDVQDLVKEKSMVHKFRSEL